MRKGWCPGVRRPMASGDGLLVRVRAQAGRLSLDQAAAIAEGAALYGNGAIDLSQRANLQIRGVSPNGVGKTAPLAALTARLDAVGLVDRDATGEAVRNVIVAPLSGIDPDAVDLVEIAQELEHRLASEANLHALPGKFGFALCGGGAFPLGAVSADLRLDAKPNGVWTIALQGDTAVASVAPSGAVAVLLRLARLFLAERAGGARVRRMGDWVAAIGAEAIFRRAGLEPVPAMTTRPALRRPIGALTLGGELCAVGLGLPFGRIAATALAHLIDEARAVGVTELRLSPDRALVLPVDGEADAQFLLAVGAMLGLVIDPADPLLAIDACPGAPACAAAQTATRAHAMDLAAQLGPRPGAAPDAAPEGHPTVHVSGCAKGCARHTAADVTLVAGADGRYDLILGGRVGDPPVATGIAPSALGLVVERAWSMRETVHGWGGP